jgi:hypothetical protein
MTPTLIFSNKVTRRPLYCVSAGELGTDAKTVDKALIQILELAQTWKAVLLLDEADVFLYQRSNNDVIRNALVSIFLRQLEYYQGILFLTTNMIAQCDLAFESTSSWIYSGNPLTCLVRSDSFHAALPSVGRTLAQADMEDVYREDSECW